MKAILSEKGQITIPAPLRAKLALKPGATIDFEVRGGELIGRKAAATRSKLARGYLKKRLRMTVDEYIESVRGK